MENKKPEPIIKPPEVDPRFNPSPTMRVSFGDGHVIAMNRKQRRRQHLYGDRLKVNRR